MAKSGLIFEGFAIILDKVKKGHQIGINRRPILSSEMFMMHHSFVYINHVLGQWIHFYFFFELSNCLFRIAFSGKIPVSGLWNEKENNHGW